MNDKPKTEATFLPYGRQCLDEDDIEAVIKVLHGDWLTGGPAVDAFEKAFAEKTGAKFAIACSSGTAALHMAAEALELGDAAVIIPSITFLATANAPKLTGASIFFSDVSPETGLMEDKHLRRALEMASGMNKKAVIPVHLAGQCVDMEKIALTAREYGLKVIEDACHALGAYTLADDGAKAAVGSCRYSDMTVFSFHPVKTITSGEGGMVTTNDPELNQRLRQIRNHGITRDPVEFLCKEEAFDQTGIANPWYYEMHEIGNNYRLSDIHSALCLSQLDKLDRFLAKRLELVAYYDQLLAPLASLLIPLGRSAKSIPAWHLYVVRINFAKLSLSRGELMQQLRNQGIGTQVHYIPIHHQPYYTRLTETPQKLSGADAYYRSCLSLPLFPQMSKKDVIRVVDTLGEILC